MSLTSLLALLSVYECGSSSVHWDYTERHHNVSEWVKHWPECGGQHQSPIDLISTSDCNELLTLDWTSESSHFGIRNNGHTLHVIPLQISHKGGSDISGLEILHHTNDTNIRLKNSFYNTYKSAVNAEYCFDSLHFHWGTTDEYGSEHAVNGQHFPLELHLVHYSCDYYTVETALNAYTQSNDYDDHNILAVIAVLFEVGDEAHPVLDKIFSDVIIDGVLQYVDPESEHDNVLKLFYTEFDIKDLLPTNREMFAYIGSLTTPPCYETVRWHIMKEKVSVTQAQLAAFRSILESANMTDRMAPNWRPLQEIHDRNLYECGESVDAESVEKDALINVDDTEIAADDNYYNEYKSWFVVAVIFICLFVVSLLVVGYLSYSLYFKTECHGGGGGATKGKYKKPVNDDEAVANTEDYH